MTYGHAHDLIERLHKRMEEQLEKDRLEEVMASAITDAAELGFEWLDDPSPPTERKEKV